MKVYSVNFFDKNNLQSGIFECCIKICKSIYNTWVSKLFALNSAYWNENC